MDYTKFSVYIKTIYLAASFFFDLNRSWANPIPSIETPATAPMTHIGTLAAKYARPRNITADMINDMLLIKTPSIKNINPNPPRP